MRNVIGLAAILMLTAACQGPEPSGAQPKPSSSEDPAPAEDQIAEASTGTVFYLSDRERSQLESRANAGDGESANRLAQFYSLGGGASDDPATDEADRAAELKWLRRAAELGHDSARHNLKFVEADEACRRTVGLPDTSPDRVAANLLRQEVHGAAC